VLFRSATLEKGEAAIEVIRTFSDFEKENIAYIAFTLYPGAEYPVLTVMNNGDYLEGKGFKYLYNAILYKIKDNRSYNSYWEPIKASIPPETRVIYFSADGVYNLINPNTLFNKATNQYIIEEYNIRLLSSTRELLDGDESGNPSNNAVLMGYPDYATDTAEQPNTSPPLNPTNMIIADTVVNQLPGTAAEVDTLNQILNAYHWNTSVYTRQQATEEQIKKVNSPKLLHIATHGYFLQDVEVNDQEKAYGIHIQNVKANPLLRSGLLLAGAQNTINGSLRTSDSVAEDGILTAYEAMNLDLDETEMVVMSACETGLGEVRNGEGVYGLQRAFMVAGAKSVIMSLWKVDDETTQELMRIFYSRWMNGEDKLTAFYKAQIELKAKFNDPYYWGGFVMLGL
jgi:CHAT domain-containing protein